ncbi:hypothetical protein Tco_0921995 [Tanacetum coccineum]|uniref:DNA-directed DNA polymerase n=1 Tax=Tanacetum coccineum TaxID=301880 RepID=A0ABQ5D068_9ASTR
MRLVNGIINFGSGMITVYPEHDPFEDEYEKTEKSMHDWDQLLDFNFDDIPQLDGEELPLFVCKIGKGSRNKKRAIENLNLFYPDIRPSSSSGRHLTQEEAAKEALAHRISQKFALLEEVRPVLETMAYHDKYKKVLDEIWKYKVELDGMIFGAPIYGPKPAAYLNCNDPAERSLALQEVINPFRKISVWKKAVSFLSSLPVPLQHINWKPDYKGCYTNEEEAKGQLWEETMMNLDNQDPNALDNTKPWKRYCFHKFIMNSYYGKVATKRQSLVYADDELQTKKIIKFRLGGRTHSLTLLEFTRRLGLYHAEELDEKGFDVYFQGDLCSDDHFNAQEYWYDKIQKNDLWLLSMFDARHQNGYANVAWLIARWMKKKGAGTQKESQICCGQFIMKIARKVRVLSDVVLRSLSAPIYCKDLDTTTLRELIDSEGRLILKYPQPGVPRVAIPRPPRASMQDLYNRMGNMEIRQGAIERMSYRQSYHWDRYAGVFEHMVGVYSVSLQGAYNPPGYP